MVSSSGSTMFILYWCSPIYGYMYIQRKYIHLIIFKKRYKRYLSNGTTNANHVRQKCSNSRRFIYDTRIEDTHVHSECLRIFPIYDSHKFHIPKSQYFLILFQNGNALINIYVLIHDTPRIVLIPNASQCPLHKAPPLFRIRSYVPQLTAE